MMVHDGQIIGSWKRTVKSKHIDLVANFATQPTKKQWNAFEKCASRFEEFNKIRVIHSKQSL